MTISFECDACGRTIKAPDAAGGKRGKCPYCGQSNDIPRPPAEADDDNDTFALAPLDDEQERLRAEQVQQLIAQERDLLADSGGEEAVPLEHREDLGPEDLHHFVVNYCRDMADGKLDRAGAHVQKLRRFRLLAQEAVGAFLSGQASEEALGSIPPRVLEGFLKTLRDELK